MTQTIIKCDFCENFIDPKQLGRHVLSKVVQHEDGSVALHPVADICDECVKKLEKKDGQADTGCAGE